VGLSRAAGLLARAARPQMSPVALGRATSPNAREPELPDARSTLSFVKVAW
jgi:hypothetical protein